MLYATLNELIASLREAIPARNHPTIRRTMINIRELRQRIERVEGANAEAHVG